MQKTLTGKKKSTPGSYLKKTTARCRLKKCDFSMRQIKHAKIKGNTKERKWRGSWKRLEESTNCEQD